MPRTKLALLFVGAAVLMAASILYVFDWTSDPPRREMGGRYHPVSVEGLSCTVDGVGIALDKFAVRKMKWGGVTLGGFNVLEIENLCLTLYEGDQSVAAGSKPGAKTKGSRKSGGEIESKCIELVSTASNSLSAVRAILPKDTQVSGIRIRGMKILKAHAAEEPQPWLEASLVRNSGKDLRISGLAETVDGVRHDIGEARLVVRHGYYLVNGTNAAERIRLL